MSKLTEPKHSYTLRVSWNWVWGYLRQGKILAAIRTLWYSIVLGHYGEACQECGHPYNLWHANDALYARVTGNSRQSNGEAPHGLFCPDCFHVLAEKKGIELQWNPSDVHELGIWNEVDCVNVLPISTTRPL